MADAAVEPKGQPLGADAAGGVGQAKRDVGEPQRPLVKLQDVIVLGKALQEFVRRLRLAGDLADEDRFDVLEQPAHRA